MGPSFLLIPFPLDSCPTSFLSFFLSFLFLFFFYFHIFAPTDFSFEFVFITILFTNTHKLRSNESKTIIKCDEDDNKDNNNDNINDDGNKDDGNKKRESCSSLRTLLFLLLLPVGLFFSHSAVPLKK